MQFEPACESAATPVAHDTGDGVEQEAAPIHQRGEADPAVAFQRDKGGGRKEVRVREFKLNVLLEGRDRAGQSERNVLPQRRVEVVEPAWRIGHRLLQLAVGGDADSGTEEHVGMCIDAARDRACIDIRQRQAAFDPPVVFDEAAVEQEGMRFRRILQGLRQQFIRFRIPRALDQDFVQRASDTDSPVRRIDEYAQSNASRPRRDARLLYVTVTHDRYIDGGDPCDVQAFGQATRFRCGHLLRRGGPRWKAPGTNAGNPLAVLRQLHRPQHNSALHGHR